MKILLVLLAVSVAALGAALPLQQPPPVSDQSPQPMREQIRDQLAGGWSEDEMMDYFVSQYGERVLAEPGRSGFTSFLWVLPLLVVVLGLVTLSATLRKWRARSTGQSRSSSVDGPDPIDVEVPPDVRTRIEEDVQDLT